jgi:hypothetical protein
VDLDSTPHYANLKKQNNYTNNKGHTTHNKYNANTITTSINTILFDLVAKGMFNYNSAKFKSLTLLVIW